MDDTSGFQVDAGGPSHYHDQVERLMAPFVEALVATGLNAGDAVLDIACGTGFATRAAALAVGPSGRVVGCDLNPAMVAMARSVPNDSGVEIAWLEASALDLPFADDEFDAVISQQGIQFFPDIAAGLRDMARTARPGGRIAATVWAPMDRVPFLAAEIEMLVEYCGHDPAGSAGAFATKSEVAGWFEEAGIVDTRVELVEAVVTLPPVAAYVPEHLKALPWSGTFFSLPDEIRQEAVQMVDDRLVEYRSDAGIAVPFGSFLATAAT